MVQFSARSFSSELLGWTPEQAHQFSVQLLSSHWIHQNHSSSQTQSCELKFHLYSPHSRGTPVPAASWWGWSSQLHCALWCWFWLCSWGGCRAHRRPGMLATAAPCLTKKDTWKECQVKYGVFASAFTTGKNWAWEVVLVSLLVKSSHTKRTEFCHKIAWHCILTMFKVILFFPIQQRVVLSRPDQRCTGITEFKNDDQTLHTFFWMNQLHLGDVQLLVNSVQEEHLVFVHTNIPEETPGVWWQALQGWSGGWVQKQDGASIGICNDKHLVFGVENWPSGHCLETCVIVHSPKFAAPFHKIWLPSSLREKGTKPCLEQGDSTCDENAQMSQLCWLCQLRFCCYWWSIRSLNAPLLQSSSIFCQALHGTWSLVPNSMVQNSIVWRRHASLKSPNLQIWFLDTPNRTQVGVLLLPEQFPTIQVCASNARMFASAPSLSECVLSSYWCRPHVVPPPVWPFTTMLPDLGSTVNLLLSVSLENSRSPNGYEKTVFNSSWS